MSGANELSASLSGAVEKSKFDPNVTVKVKLDLGQIELAPAKARAAKQK